MAKVQVGSTAPDDSIRREFEKQTSQVIGDDPTGVLMSGHSIDLIKGCPVVAEHPKI